jgi:hypothetical protein
MDSKKQPRTNIQKNGKSTESKPTLSADDAMQRAMNVRRPPGGWPWEAKAKKK